MTTRKTFFITVKRQDNLVSSHTVSFDRPVTSFEEYENLKTRSANKATLASSSFEEVLRLFEHNMAIYMDFVPTTLNLMPSLSEQIATLRLDSFLRNKAARRPEMGDGRLEVYELDVGSFSEYKMCEDQMGYAASGVKHIPQIMIIGLVSTYDYFLSRLLDVILRHKPEIIFTSEKSIKFSDLVGYNSIEEARNTIISKEIETVLRSSHTDQFDWMEKHFSVPLRQDLKIWPVFVEVCERRNLFTHTGGLVSQQYISVCSKHKCNIKGVGTGDFLAVEAKYFTEAVRAFFEIGAKLTYVLWRKFSKDETDKADSLINQLCLELIVRGSYQIAEAILTFTSSVMKKSRGSELIRRMMIVNLANSKVLQNRQKEADKVLAQEDWTASGPNFQVCIASIKGDVDDAIKWMNVVGQDASPSLHEYRSWPCFREISKNIKFQEAF